LVNKYPGLTCDVPIHIYTLPWAPKHDWTRYMASGDEILRYMRDVTAKFGLNRCIKFNTSLDEAVWTEDAGKWKLQGTMYRGVALVHR
jgi:cation diffusion facilitator CzcD-associated flavoprotein CzcO